MPPIKHDGFWRHWWVEPLTACVLHKPTGMRVCFRQDADDPGVWNGTPDAAPPELLARAEQDGGRQLAQLMREAGDVYHDYLTKEWQ